ncbi:hypothetical protein [Selenomonas sp. AE3005]|uniref:hypothetical protein n=1 Tax=Selenomonas sp. AE3005 TaxID=1485543 RepID=UPI000ABA7535|nr:hypothetical protein [Selenomonas sp. AE3005]
MMDKKELNVMEKKKMEIMELDNVSGGEGAADKKLDSDGGYYDVIFIRAETKSLAAV